MTASQPLQVAPDPRDRYSGFTPLWLAWIATFGVIEAIALREDAKHRDHVKRTLSSNMRSWAATDSVTGIPLDVRYGKLRRLGLLVALTWFGHHIARQGEM